MRRKILAGIAVLVFLCLIVAIFGQTAQKPASSPASVSPAPLSPTFTPVPRSTATSRPPTPTPILPRIVTKAMYDRIETGMSYQQVVAIIGWNGEELSRSDVAGYVTVMYSWMNPNGSNMNVMLQNNKVVSKAQFGLK